MMKKSKTSKQGFEIFLRSRHKRVNKLLNKYLTAVREPKNLCEAMRYSVLGGGKRLRPLLVYAVGEMYGADLKVLDIPACAIEVIHSFSLIHDDLPAMDNDDLRRGKLTCHKAFDEATAILAGDALAIFAFQLINESEFLAPKQAVAMNKVLALAVGLRGMAGGQDMDVQSASNRLSAKKLEQMYLLKTGALLGAALKLGALAASVSDPKEFKILDQFAKNIGLAFQIQDDIFNIESSANKLGKNVGTDEKYHKITYPALVGIPVAKAKVKQLWQRAEKSLRQLKVNTQTLQALVAHIRQRDY
ncbi:geranyl diphosphate/farnesyl diphosphate synthase [Gammaproteobacteria bacterium]